MIISSRRCLLSPTHSELQSSCRPEEAAIMAAFFDAPGLVRRHGRSPEPGHGGAGDPAPVSGATGRCCRISPGIGHSAGTPPAGSPGSAPTARAELRAVIPVHHTNTARGIQRCCAGGMERMLFFSHLLQPCDPEDGGLRGNNTGDADHSLPVIPETSVVVFFLTIPVAGLVRARRQNAKTRRGGVAIVRIPADTGSQVSDVFQLYQRGGKP